MSAHSRFLYRISAAFILFGAGRLFGAFAALYSFIYTEKHVIVIADHRQKAFVNHIPNLSNR
jgi:hypothetical protein